MEGNVRWMSVLKIGLESSKQGHGCCGLGYTSHLVWPAEWVGKLEESGPWGSKLLLLRLRRFPNHFPTNLAHRDSGWPCLELPAHPEALACVQATGTGLGHSLKCWYSPPHHASFGHDLWHGHLSLGSHSLPERGPLKFKLQMAENWSFSWSHNLPRD